MVQNSSAYLKADIVTVKEAIAESKDLIADLITDNVAVKEAIAEFAGFIAGVKRSV